MSETFKTVAALSVICPVCAFLVAAAHELTRGPIADALARQKQESILAVLPGGADSAAEEKTIVIGGVTNTYFETSSGYVMEAVTKGYAGEIRLMLGFAKGGVGEDGAGAGEPKFWAYKTLSHTETPGLGSHIAGSFSDNVKERDAFATNWRVTKDGGDIVPITSATISSRAVTDAIGRAAEIIKTIIDSVDSVDSIDSIDNVDTVEKIEK